jgi:hypothetical protein
VASIATKNPQHRITNLLLSSCRYPPLRCRKKKSPLRSESGGAIRYRLSLLLKNQGARQTCPKRTLSSLFALFWSVDHAHSIPVAILAVYALHWQCICGGVSAYPCRNDKFMQEGFESEILVLWTEAHPTHDVAIAKIGSDNAILYIFSVGVTLGVHARLLGVSVLNFTRT